MSFAALSTVDRKTLAQALVSLDGTFLFATPSDQLQSIEVTYKGIPLYRYDAITCRLSITNSEDSRKHDIIELIDRAGLYDIELEFLPVKNTFSQFTVSDGQLIQNGNRIPLAKRSGEKDFGNWVRQACSALGNSVELIPDTGFIRRHYYSNIFQHLLPRPNPVAFILSRLVQWEINEQYKRAKSDLDNALKKKPDKAERAMMELALAFQTYNELRAMSQAGVTQMPEIGMAVKSKFISDSGKGMGDDYIISEIKHYISGESFRTEDDVVIKSDKIMFHIAGEPPAVTNYVFITPDKQAALRANIDGINAVVVSRIETGTVQLNRLMLDADKIAVLIVNTAILYGECDVMCKGNSMEIARKFLGTWSGKSMQDWEKDVLQVKPYVKPAELHQQSQQPATTDE